MRAFIALPLVSDVLDALEEQVRALARAGTAVRWTRRDAMHLTVKFLGETDPLQIPDLRRVLQSAAAAHPSLRLRLASLGAFPTLEAPRVIWCGVAGDVDVLASLVRAVEAGCERLGWAPEQRPFHPHLTLGRVTNPRQAAPLADPVRTSRDAPLGRAFVADRVQLYRSTLRPGGAVHDVVATELLRRAAS